MGHEEAITRIDREIRDLKIDIKDLRKLAENDIKDLSKVVQGFIENIVGLSHDSDHSEKAILEIKSTLEKVWARLDIMQDAQNKIQLSLTKVSAIGINKKDEETIKSKLVSTQGLIDIIKYLVIAAVGGGAGKLF